MKRSGSIAIISIGLLTAVFIYSCTKDTGKLPVKTPEPVVGECDTITYTKHIKKIVADYCISCHGAGVYQSSGGGTVLETYADVKGRADAGRIKERVIDGKPSFMPLGGELSPAQKKLVTCWLSNGAKE